MKRAAGHECYHCKQWIPGGQDHDCWTTTEAALTRDLPSDLKDAYERIRETAVAFGEQRIYASLNSIMFSRKACYFFVRPKRSYLEVCIFLGRALKAPELRKVAPASKVKFANLLRVEHRDQVEAPITDWLREAYEFSNNLPANHLRASRFGGQEPGSHGTSGRKRKAPAVVSSRSGSAARNPRRSRRAASASPRTSGRKT